MACTGSVPQFAWQLSALKTAKDVLPCNEELISGHMIYHIFKNNKNYSAIVNKNLPAIWHGNKISGGKQTVKEIEASRLLSSN